LKSHEVAALIIEREILEILTVDGGRRFAPGRKTFGKTPVVRIESLRKFSFASALNFVVAYDGNIRNARTIEPIKHFLRLFQIPARPGASPSDVPHDKHQFYVFAVPVANYPVNGRLEFGILTRIAADVRIGYDRKGEGPAVCGSGGHYRQSQKYEHLPA
jgi:hypothetical protein